MPEIINQRSLISPPVETAVETRADRDLPVTSDTKSQWRADWQKLIDQYLTTWLRDPEIIADEGVDPPSTTILRLAIDYAERFRDEGFPPPGKIVPDADGGIVFERRHNGTREIFHFWDDGAIEYALFSGGRLIQRFEL